MHVDVHGAVLQKIPSPGQIRGIAVALDESVWVLGAKTLYHYTSSGSALASIDLSPLVDGEPKLLQVDSIAAWILVAGEKRVLRVDSAGATPAVLSPLPFSADSLALDEMYGTFYVLSAGTVYPIGSSGISGTGVDLGTYGISGASEVAFDSASQDLFVGHAAGVTRLDRNIGAPLLIPLPDAAQTIGAAPLLLQTSVALLTPAPGSITNHPLPEFRLQLVPTCSGNPCNFAPSFFKTYSISVLLNSQQIGSLFVPGPDAGIFTYTPGIRLPEGTNTLVGRATDMFGQASPDTTATWVIDTIPPSFVLLLPASPTLTNHTSIEISGRISEPSTLVAGTSNVPVGADNSFSITEPLVEGDNSISLTATDLAGNSTTTSLLITRDTIPPTISNLVPADGSTASNANVNITFQTSEWANVTITGPGGQVGGANGTGFSFPVTLAQGLNQFSISATDRAGNTSTQTLNLTLSNPVTLTVTIPQNGATINGTTIYVAGTVTSDSVVGVSVNGTPAALVGTQFVAQLDVAAGPAQLVVTATTPSGTSTSTSLWVTAAQSSRPVPVITPSSGIAPYTAQIQVPDGVMVQTDFNGDGVIDRVDQGPITDAYTFTVPGVYLATMQVTDAAGSYSLTIPIAVQDVKALDQAAQATYNSMMSKLRAGDITGALQFFTPEAASRYGPVFQALGPRVAQNADLLGTIVDGYIFEGFAEYLLVQNRPSGQQGFLIYILQGPDGLWRIAQM